MALMLAVCPSRSSVTQRYSIAMRSNLPQCYDYGRRCFELLLLRGGVVSLCRCVKLLDAALYFAPAVLRQEVFSQVADGFMLSLILFSW